MNIEKYDSFQDTCAHIKQVQFQMTQVILDLKRRASTHDLSKFESPEREVFDEMTPKLKSSTYGSEEYKGFLAQMKPALDHHYAHNDHHPEHHGNGIYGMSLLELLEMLCDWKAATMRHSDGDLVKSIRINAGRFGYDANMERMLLKTAGQLGMIPGSGGNIFGDAGGYK